MRFGINTFLFTSPFTNESTKLFKTFRKWGFQTVEIPVEDPSHIDPAHVKSQLDYHGLVCGSVCACMGPGRDFRGTPEEQQTAMDYCKALLDQMVVLDCPSLIGPVYSVVGKADAVEPARQKEEWALVVNNLKALAKYAETRGRQICVEPLNRFETDFLNTCDQGVKLVKAVGSRAVKLHLDTFHMNIEEKLQGPAIRKAGRLLGHFHACGSDRGTPGKGHVPWAPTYKALRAAKYDGRLTIEAFGRAVPALAAATRVWRDFFPNKEEVYKFGFKSMKQGWANAGR